VSNIFYTILPLLVLIVIGYSAGKTYKLSTSQYGYMVAFVLAPLVSLGAVLQLQFKIEYVFLPFIVAFICCTTTIISFKLAKIYLSGAIPNLAGMASSGGNTGFFGLPVFLLFAPMKMLGVYLLANLGTQIIEVTFGYYLGSRGHLTVRDSLIKLIKIPSLWAVVIAVTLNSLGVTMSPIVYEYWKKILDAWLVIGMMMIGIALASCSSLKPDIKFCLHMMFVRFIVWPFVCAAVIALDYCYIHALNPNIYFILAVISIVPLPGNAVALSATLGLHPDKIAFAVVLSTIIAAGLVPLVIEHIHIFLLSLG
jgi:malate permease and related proteins